MCYCFFPSAIVSWDRFWSIWPSRCWLQCIVFKKVPLYQLLFTTYHVDTLIWIIYWLYWHWFTDHWFTLHFWYSTGHSLAPFQDSRDPTSYTQESRKLKLLFFCFAKPEKKMKNGEEKVQLKKRKCIRSKFCEWAIASFLLQLLFVTFFGPFGFWGPWIHYLWLVGFSKRATSHRAFHNV